MKGGKDLNIGNSNKRQDPQSCKLELASNGTRQTLPRFFQLLTGPMSENPSTLLRRMPKMSNNAKFERGLLKTNEAIALQIRRILQTLVWWE